MTILLGSHRGAASQLAFKPGLFTTPSLLVFYSPLGLTVWISEGALVSFFSGSLKQAVYFCRLLWSTFHIASPFCCHSGVQQFPLLCLILPFLPFAFSFPSSNVLALPLVLSIGFLCWLLWAILGSQQVYWGRHWSCWLGSSYRDLTGWKWIISEGTTLPEGNLTRG